MPSAFLCHPFCGLDGRVHDDTDLGPLDEAEPLLVGDVIPRDPQVCTEIGVNLVRPVIADADVGLARLLAGHDEDAAGVNALFNEYRDLLLGDERDFIPPEDPRSGYRYVGCRSTRDPLDFLDGNLLSVPGKALHEQVDIPVDGA